MATVTETGEQVFAVVDEIGRRRMNTVVLEDGRYFFPRGAATNTTTVPLRTLMGVGI